MSNPAGKTNAPATEKRNKRRVYVRLPVRHAQAIQRVLALLGGYLGDMPEALHGHGGGMMTTSELKQHAVAASDLLWSHQKRKRK